MEDKLKYSSKRNLNVLIVIHWLMQEWVNSNLLGDNIVELYEHLYLNYREKLQSYEQKYIRGF